MTALPQAADAARPLLGRGRVWHRRLRPAQHEFSHASYFLLLPMRSLRAQPHAALHRNRFGMLSFQDRDHGDGRADALAWLDSVLAAEGITDAQGEVWLQTYPRVLGHVFKPVSFWYAHRSDGSLAAVLAEVNNTFGQRHCYLLHGPTLCWGGEMQADKAWLTAGDVFTDDFIDTYVSYKTENEVEPFKFRPNPYEFYLYYDC